MMLSGVTPYSGYQVLGIYGNPSSVNPVSRISEDTRKSNPLVTVTEEPKQMSWEDMDLPKATNTSVNSFSDVMKRQELTGMAFEQNDEEELKMSDTMEDSLNQTIGLMGYQNALREKLMGTGFQAF